MEDAAVQAVERVGAWPRERLGLIAFYASRPLPDSNDRSRCMVEIWQNVEAIQTAIGEDWQQPPGLPEEARAFVESASVEHYELADEFQSPEPRSLAVMARQA